MPEGVENAPRQLGRADPARAERIPVLELTGIVKSWPSQPTPVLDSVSLRLEPSTVAAISGRTGAGMTPLLRTAAGRIAAESGTVSVCELDVASDRPEFQRRIGFLAAGNG